MFNVIYVRTKKKSLVFPLYDLNSTSFKDMCDFFEFRQKVMETVPGPSTL